MTTNHHPAPCSICLFRLSAIGDATHVVPVIKTLQHKYPDCKITWVIGKVEHKLLKGLPGVEFVEFNKADGWQAIKKMRSTFNGIKFDVLLQMQLSFRANLVSRFIPASRRIGFDVKRSKEGHGLVINERIPYLHNCHVLDGFMQFADYLGCDEKIMNWDIPTDSEDDKLASEIIAKNQINVVISPCSSHKLRNWSIERYAAVADWLVEKYNAQVILTGSPSPKETEFVSSIQATCKQTVTDIAGKDTLKQLLCLLKQADLVISPDSGPLHMAGSVGTPVVGLMAASNNKRSGSYQFADLAVDKYPEACIKFLNKSVEKVKWGTKTEFPGAMDLIQVADVQQKITEVLMKS
jgi:heptosyltransferase I